MILSDRMIREARARGEIVIEPWDDECLGSNSYDIHLGDTLKTYRDTTPLFDDEGNIVTEYGYAERRKVLDCSIEWPTVRHKIGPRGFVLQPGVLYLGVTQEYTETLKHVPFLDGKSSAGRLGVPIHCTAGRGDVGFKNHWTLEIWVVQPVRLFAGMPIGQLIYQETGDVDVPYDRKPNAKYSTARDPEPQASRMWRNFPLKPPASMS